MASRASEHMRYPVSAVRRVVLAQSFMAALLSYSSESHLARHSDARSPPLRRELGCEHPVSLDGVGHPGLGFVRHRLRFFASAGAGAGVGGRLLLSGLTGLGLLGLRLVRGRHRRLHVPYAEVHDLRAVAASAGSRTSIVSRAKSSAV